MSSPTIHVYSAAKGNFFRMTLQMYNFFLNCTNIFTEKYVFCLLFAIKAGKNRNKRANGLKNHSCRIEISEKYGVVWNPSIGGLPLTVRDG